MATPVFRSLRLVAGLAPRAWLDLVRATFELMIARVKLDPTPARFFLQPPPSGAPSLPYTLLSAQQEQLVKRVAFAVPCIGARVPWRSDCLIQALAAQRWLARAGIAAPIDIGVRNAGAFEAHAWLVVGGKIVTGGDISGFTPFEPLFAKKW